MHQWWNITIAFNLNCKITFNDTKHRQIMKKKLNNTELVLSLTVCSLILHTAYIVENSFHFCLVIPSTPCPLLCSCYNPWDFLISRNSPIPSNLQNWIPCDIFFFSKQTRFYKSCTVNWMILSTALRIISENKLPRISSRR